MSTNSHDFHAVIAACLGHPDRQEVLELLHDVLVKAQPCDRTRINRLQQKITQLLGRDGDKIDLIYGGATKIKGYVFEADRLPEIRGASALLDFVGIDEVKRIIGEDRVIYAGGGSFLAFAPAGEGQKLATQIECRFTELTQTAQSVVVVQTFRLIELRFGRVVFNAQGQVAWWLEEFQKAWRDKDLRPELEQYYYEVAEKTPGARFYNRKTFGELITLLTTMYHRRRDERAAHGETRAMPIIERLPHAIRCASSDHRPAIIEANAYGERPMLSEASVRKLAVGLKVKRDQGGKAEHLAGQITWEIPEIISWEMKWKTYLREEGQATPYAQHAHALTAQPAFDIQQIGAAGNGFIGLIYADGNNVGRALAQLKTPQEYAEFSGDLECAARKAVFTGLAQHLLPKQVRDDMNGQEIFIDPFEILSIGGDDLILIVPGTHALDIALTIGKEFERALGDDKQPHRRETRYTPATDFDTYKPKIGLSAGIVIAKADAPIFFLRQLAEELLGSAKNKVRFLPEAGGAVDFMVMKSITMVTDKIKGFRAMALEGTQCNLTARPYLWPELAGLLATLRGLIAARVPRSQLYRLRMVLEAARDQGHWASTMEYLYTRTRQGKDQHAALYTHIEQNWHGAALSPPWMAIDTKRETIWADLVEIYDMVKFMQEAPHATT
ncbi:hydrolase [Oscillochloris trichoides DG-6]|uniref:Hydrolase n=1 Tax=Oscillochloris trichoides DG-6 TaxID=765420 RepID=E1IGE1_9CHLR|nr:hypothetical protein [Oscillochloris trichoides]EFO79707.1 hydrolase [Oscillochloris trichoides DG-6]